MTHAFGHPWLLSLLVERPVILLMHALCYTSCMDVQRDATFGATLRAAVEAAGITQASLANELQIDPGQVSRWVNDKSIPNHSVVARLEQILSADLSASFSEASSEYELFVAAPITGLKPEDIGPHQAAVAQVVKAARVHVNDLYWTGEKLGGLSDLPAADLATERNMGALSQCSAFLYLQFMDVARPSSALIELGIALGRRLRTTLIVQAGVPLPYMLRGFSGVAASLAFLPKVRIYTVDSAEEASVLIARNGRELLGL